jgi:hypothetical protein
MSNLKRYVKENKDKLDAVTTSVQLEKKHMAFIKRLNLNLSLMVRDMLDKMLADETRSSVAILECLCHGAFICSTCQDAKKKG